MRRNAPIILFVSILILAGLACGEATESKAVETAVVEAQEEQNQAVDVSKTEKPAEVDPKEDSSEPVASPVPPEPTSIPEPTSTPEPPPTPEPSPTPILGLIGVGTHIVGSDIQPGIYWGLAGYDLFESCYWARLSDLSGEFSSLIANDNANGSYYIEVIDTDFALKTDCELIQIEHAPILEMGDEYPPGTYIVGRDIEPGMYQGQAGADILESCYWSRLTSVSGGFDSIIANDNANGSYYIQVADSDFAVNTACPLVRVDG